MDMKKINNLLNDKFDDDDELNEEDLEDELEAILSGRAPIKAPSRASMSQVQQEKQSRSAARRAPPPPAKASSRNVGANKRGQPVNAPMLDISQVERMLKGFDDDHYNDNADELDDDDDLGDLESELDLIVNSGGGGASKSATAASSTQPSYVAAPPSQPPPPAPSAFSSVPLKPQVLPSISRPPPPPPVRIPEPDYNTDAPAPPPRREAPAAAPPNANAQKIAQIKQLQIEYKRAALKAKNDQDKTAALAHFKVSKQLDAMIESLNANQDVDMSTLPPMPSGSSAPVAASSSAAAPSSSSQPSEAFDVPEITQDDASKLFNAPKSANTVLEALQQRLDKFKSTLKEATDEQNSSKARRLGRVVKQVETAIKDYKAGKQVDFDSIPCPPGFPDIPQPSQQSESKPTAAPSAATQQAQPSQAKPAGLEAPAKKVPPASQPSGAAAAAAAAAVAHPKPPLKRGLSTTGSKQLKWLLERQRLFREAALEAKKRNEIEQAKEYLRHAKGFEPLIEATKNGLPIDATSVPTPPQLNTEEDFVVVNSQTVPSTIASRRAQVAEGSASFYTDLERDELFRNIEKELLDQIDMCNRNKDYFAKMGDVSTSSKFEKYATEGSKDLNMLRVRWHNGDNIPTYRTETRTFSIVVSNFDVGINELQVDVLKALDLPGKPEIDTYIRVEVPLPSSEAPQRKKTKTVYDTINPEFNESIKFELDRKSRSLTRILKRHPIKLEVFVKGGLFKSDACLGTVQLKVGDILEKQCTIHQSVQLMDGRKTLHGRLEFKVKLREPLLAKQIEEIKEKWIVFS